MSVWVALLLTVAGLIFAPMALLTVAAMIATLRAARRATPATPAGHMLGDPYTIRNSSRSLYCLAADCACGITVYDTALPSLWGRHDQHLAEVRARSMRSHPSGGAA